MKKHSRILLTISLVMVVVSMLVSSAVQTSFGRVEYREISLVTRVGTLTGYLLIPDSATVDNPSPAIVTSHGYLNNRELQDINYVELSRRGYVVFAMNAYKHGDSSVPDERFNDTISVKSGGMVDAVEYLASLPFVDVKQIGVTGHSMGGGFTYTTAAYFSELEKEKLAEGADPEEAKALNLVASALMIGSYPNDLASKSDHSGNDGLLCDLGVIVGRYDEFFASSGNPGFEILSTSKTHDLLAVQTGTRQDGDLEEGRFYSNPDNGFILAVYNPTETHAQNHFSPRSAEYAIDFFQESLPTPHALPAGNQTWWIKELFNLVGLIGFFMFLVPFAELLLSNSFFRELKKDEIQPAAALQPGRQRRRFILSIVLNAILCAVLLFPMMMVGYLLMINRFLPQDTTGGIGLWAAVSGLVGLLMLRISSGSFKGRSVEFGVKISWRAFGRSILLALLVVSGAYVLLFFADYAFQTDFRIWSFDLRVFSANKVLVALRYLPIYMVYFVINSLMVSRNTFENWKESKQVWMSVLFSILTPALFLVISFLPLLFGEYTFWGLVFEPGSLLSGAGALVPILMFPILPILGIAAYVSIRLYKLTGSIWPGGLLNAMLFTMITVANTSFSFPY